MSEPFDWHILDRHLAGESSPDEDAAVRAWLARDPRHAELLDAARAAGRAPEPRDAQAWNADRAWSRVAARMHESPDPTLVPLRARPVVDASGFVGGARRRIGVAVAIIAAAGIGSVLWERSATHTNAPAVTPAREVVAAVGQQTRVTLDDGTRVVLNAGSRLRYSSSFGATARDVELEGEGYFDVVHDDSRPFRVYARGSVAQDVGTRFVVRAYPEQPTVDVIVTHGVVALRQARATNPAATLTAGQRGRVEPSGAVTVVDDPDVERWTAWTRGGLVLEGMTLREAAVELSRRFGVPVRVQRDEVARRRVSARFNDEPLPRVLDALAAALDVRWRRETDGIVIVEGD